MTSKGVWYPGKSVAESQDVDGCEEWGRGWSTAAPEAKVPREHTAPERARRVKISRRVSSVATRDCRPATSAGDEKLQAQAAKVGEEEGEGLSYSTIEQRSWRGAASLLDCELHTPEHLALQVTDFCGWMEREDLMKYAPGPSKASSTSHPADRSVQTPADGSRSHPPSRASSRYSRIRREHYDFRHLAKAQDYMDHYRQFYCYSALNCPTNHPCKTITETVVKGEEEEEQCAENFMPLGVKSLYRGDPYLRELASRLGVRGPPRCREQQLLKSPHPTPPSITKRSREVTDLSVCVHGKREEETEYTNDNNNSEKMSKESSKVNSPQISRPLSWVVHQSEPRPLEPPQSSRPLSRSVHQSEPRPLELPAIPQTPSIPHRVRRHKDKSSSVISVAKYLRVSSHPHPDVPDDTETTEGQESVHSLAEELSSSSTLTVEEILDKKHSAAVPEARCVEEEVRKARFSLPEPLSLLDDHQKEQLISQKAHALGLLSRGWAKAPHIRRMMRSYMHENWQDSDRNSYSRPVTCGGGKRDDHSSSGVPNDKKAAPHSKADSPSELRPKTSRSRSVDNSKLDKLKSIYKPEKTSKQDKMKDSTQQLSGGSRCVSRLKSRPTTRLSSYDHHGRTSSSRPPTRMRSQPSGDKRVGQLPTATVKEVDVEDGHYWSELPNKAMTRHGRREAKLPSRPATRNGHVGLSQRSHSVALAIRLRKPQMWDVSANNKDVRLDSTHTKRKFDGLLDIHQQKSIRT